MSRVYQPQLNNDNWIPHELYMQIIHIIRDYDRMKSELNDLIEESPAPSDGQPRGTQTSDPTVRKALKVSVTSDKIRAVEKAIASIPEEYQDDILENIKHNKPFPDYGNRKTWSKWKGRLIRNVGINLNYL